MKPFVPRQQNTSYQLLAIINHNESIFNRGYYITIDLTQRNLLFSRSQSTGRNVSVKFSFIKMTKNTSYSNTRVNRSINNSNYTKLEYEKKLRSNN